MKTDSTAPDALDFSMINLFLESGVFVQGIMLLLFIMSLVSWAIWFAKSAQFRKLKAKANDFEDAFWHNSRIEDLYKHTQPNEADHPMARLYVSGLNEWNEAENKSKGLLPIRLTDRIRQTLSVKMIRELEVVEKNIPMLATIASTAPFIGLLGTVWGIMNAFIGIGASKNTSLAVVAPGIAEALLATALGLFAAIPAVVAYNKLSSEMGRYSARLEAFASEFITLLERKQEEKTRKAMDAMEKAEKGKQ